MEAEDLLVITNCAESPCSDYVCQMDGGPARGIFQMEKPTEKDNWDNWILARRGLSSLMNGLVIGRKTNREYLINSPQYACAMARIKYCRDSKPIPKPEDYGPEDYVRALAEYWKRVYNSNLGAGDVEECIKKVKTYGDFKL